MWVRIVELLFGLRDAAAKRVASVLPRVVRYWVVLGVTADFMLAHSEQMVDSVKAMDVLASLEKRPK